MNGDFVRIGGQILRVYAAICRIYDSGQPVTLKGIQSQLGYASINAANYPLGRLKALGWVSQDRGRQGSIVPLRRFEIYLGVK